MVLPLWLKSCIEVSLVFRPRFSTKPELELEPDVCFSTFLDSVSSVSPIRCKCWWRGEPSKMTSQSSSSSTARQPAPLHSAIVTGRQADFDQTNNVLGWLFIGTFREILNAALGYLKQVIHTKTATFIKSHIYKGFTKSQECPVVGKFNVQAFFWWTKFRRVQTCL